MHDRLMLKAALTLGFFGLLRVSEFTTTSRRAFDPKTHLTRQDIAWTKGNTSIFFIKRSKTDKAGKGTTISVVGCTGGKTCPVVTMQAYLNHCRASKHAALFHFQSGQPLSSRTLRSDLEDLLHRLGYKSSQYNTHSLWIGQQLQQHRQDSLHLPFKDWDDGAVMSSQHTPNIP